MPVSKTTICNMALGHIGVAGRIQDIDTENSKEAFNCRLYFDQCRDLLLEMQSWPFANREADLQDIGTPRAGWAYRYKYPDNCVLAIRIVNPAMRTESKDHKIPFRIVDLEDGLGKAILCDQPNAILEYNIGIEDVNRFNPMFVQALALLLAKHIAMPLRVNPDIAKFVDSQFVGWMGEATTKPYREQQEDTERPSEFVDARG